MKMGFECKLYFCVAGIGGAPVWTLVPTVKDVTLNSTASEADVTTRANAGHKAVMAGLVEDSMEFEMPWDLAAVGFQELRSAFLNRTPIGLAVMDGDITTAGSEGLWADCAVLKFDRNEKMDEAITASFACKPTYSANAPQRKLIGA